MSEFKFACPVCGQHIKCDSSQTGTVMDCPTCFQKITVPQAPADADQKFILTGSKAEKKMPATHFAPGIQAPPKKGFPVAAMVILIFLMAGGVAAFLFRGTLVTFIHPTGKWVSGDIGDVAAAGSFSDAAGTLTVAGDGADIWDQADAFHFVHQEANGDISLTVRVAEQQNTDPWAKAGVMIRDSLDANAAYVFVFVTPANGVQFQQRNSAGTAAGPVAGQGGQAPCWVRLTRHGDNFSAETSPDGTAWQKLNSASVAMDNPVYAGLAVCSHSKGNLCRAVFDNLTINGAGKKYRSAGAAPDVSVPVATPPAPPQPTAPPANDTNWTFVPDAAAIPNAPVAGRIHGQDFIIERAGFQNGTLTLRQGTRGTVEFGVTVNFEGAQAESLAGKTITVSTNAEKAARVTLRWKDGEQATKASFDNGYALLLEFGALANNKLPGKLYLCTPDTERSYLLGAFTANVTKPKPKAPPKQ